MNNKFRRLADFNNERIEHFLESMEQEIGNQLLIIANYVKNEHTPWKFGLEQTSTKTILQPIIVKYIKFFFKDNLAEQNGFFTKKFFNFIYSALTLAITQINEDILNNPKSIPSETERLCTSSLMNALREYFLLNHKYKS